jgi:hypothetical protein
MTQLEQIKRLGFRKAGFWFIDAGKLKLQLEKMSDKTNALYAYVIADGVFYVGKTRTSLKTRLSRYQKPGRSQRTNKRVKRRLKIALKHNTSVHVYALPDSGLRFYRGFHLNLAAGLEDSIVNKLQPKWNLHGKK